MTDAKVPRTPPSSLIFAADDLTDRPALPLWRIARTGGDHVLPWNRPREFGPVATQRWDPHTPPPSRQPDRALLYTATSLTTAAAEVWQATRRVDPYTGSAIVARFTPTRRLSLLDLTESSTWPVRNGASAQLAFAPRPVCRAWASAILVARPGPDGLLVPSQMNGRNVVLFPAATDALPQDSDLLVRCDDPGMVALLGVVADSIGYDI